jgi:hypothetical protein
VSDKNFNPAGGGGLHGAVFLFWMREKQKLSLGKALVNFDQVFQVLK